MNRELFKMMLKLKIHIADKIIENLPEPYSNKCKEAKNNILDTVKNVIEENNLSGAKKDSKNIKKVNIE